MTTATIAAPRQVARANGASREANAVQPLQSEPPALNSARLAKNYRRMEREVARRRAEENVLLKGKEDIESQLVEAQIAQRKLRLLTRQVISTQEEERREISRELHDEVVQTLVGIIVELATLAKGASNKTGAFRAKISRTQRLVEDSANAVDKFARALRPTILDDFGLIPALHAYAEGVAARSKFKIQLTTSGRVESIDDATRTALFRIAQEALTNIARHSGASLVKVNLTEVHAGLRMEIADNGRSFPVEKILHARNPKGMGLVGMRERTEMVGGTFAIESTPGAGTLVRVVVPFDDHPPGNGVH